MSKRPLQEKSQIKSKYFSIDSFFKPSKNESSNDECNKRIKLTDQNDKFDEQIEEAIKLSLKEQEVENIMIKKEQCPLCLTFIFTESISLEVHVNQCLDNQNQIQKQNHVKQEEPKLIDSHKLDKEEEEEEDNFFDGDDNEVIEELISFENSVQFGRNQEDQYIESASSFLSLRERFSFKSSNHSFTTTDTSQNDSGSLESSSTSIIPSSWKDTFSSTKIESDELSIMSKKDLNAVRSTHSNLMTKKKKNQKVCPFYKRVKDTRFTVDAFSYGNISDCDGYFLSHFHSDHFTGLRASWNNGPIYCSKVTANLVQQELRVESRFIRALPMNELIPIPNSNVTVGLIDANHCPGSVLFLFIVERMDGTKVRHLHTGDFRASPRMCLHPFLRQPENGFIHSLYLDTTYLSPEYAFPAQEECIQAVCETVEKDIEAFSVEKKKQPSLIEKWFQPIKKLSNSGNEQKKIFDNLMTKKTLINNTSNQPRVLIIVGTYTIGKERVFINIARRLKCKVYAPSKKKRILLCQEDDELKDMLTNNPIEAHVHVVPLRDIRADIMLKYLEDYKSHFDKLIAFKPTGWTFKSSKSQTAEMKLGSLSHIVMPPADRSLHLSPYYVHEKIKLYGVPYSEHSSFRELASFIASLDIKKIIPTVNISQLDSMSTFFSHWEEEKRSKRIEVVPYPNEDYW